MARVFDAFDQRLERPAAVKILRAETRALPGIRERFQQEALLAARLLHPHIVSVTDFGEDHASSFLVMERLPGSTLRDEIVARGAMSTQRVLLVMTETLAALAAAHSHGVLHRDIKPSNILLQEDGHTKITDFGIAKSFDSHLTAGPLTDDMTMTGVVLGTPGYLAPERRGAHPATVQSDLYSVGAVMVEMLTGRRLGAGTAQTDKVPAPFGAVARRALSDDPRLRFSSATEMLQALRGPPNGTLRGARPPGTAAAPPLPTRSDAGAALPSPPPRVERQVRRVRIHRRRLALAALAVVALAAAAFVLFEKGAQPTGPTSPVAQHHATSTRTRALTRPGTTPTTDAGSSAISALATALANGGFPGDGALSDALQATAAQPPGADRESSAQEALSLAGVLLDGGGITAGQYQDVVTTLQPTGATVRRRRPRRHLLPCSHCRDRSSRDTTTVGAAGTSGADRDDHGFSRLTTRSRELVDRGATLPRRGMGETETQARRPRRLPDMNDADAMAPEADFDPDALRLKYQLERDKRIRQEGNAQYVELAGAFAAYLEDPYTVPVDRPPVTDDVRVAIIGGGFAGLITGARLTEAGIDDFRIIEKGGDFGGTWYWNRYPGAQCDVESYVYLPLLEETSYVPSEKYVHARKFWSTAIASPGNSSCTNVRAFRPKSPPSNGTTPACAGPSRRTGVIACRPSSS